MCVNDIICCGAKPLFFLDYIACGKNYPEKIAQIVSGVAEGCVQSGAALIGGETAEMPGFYPEDEYDLAGFAVGIADRKNMLDKTAVAEGDAILALPSSGVHSNGFSLVRKVFDVAKADGALLETLLTPTKIYVKPVMALMNEVKVRSVAHITGGGLFENIPRALPDGLAAKIRTDDVRVLPVFERIAEAGKISQRDMFNTFNMGVGMICIVRPDDAKNALKVLQDNGEDAYVLGEVVKGEDGVILW